MELEELLALLLQLVGPYVARRLLEQLVSRAQDGELPSSDGCRRPLDEFDCDELGIYEEE
jgi:hypothetical protein